MQLSGVNSPNWHRWVASRVWQYAAACTNVHWRTRRSFSAPSLTSKYFPFAFVFNFLYRVRDLCPRWSTRRRAGFSCAILYLTFTQTHSFCAKYISPYKPPRKHRGEYIDRCFFNLGTRWVWVVNVTPLAALFLRRRLGTHCTGGWVGPGPVWTGMENLAPTSIRSPDSPVRSAVAILTELRRTTLWIITGKTSHPWQRFAYKGNGSEIRESVMVDNSLTMYSLSWCSSSWINQSRETEK